MSLRTKVVLAGLVAYVSSVGLFLAISRNIFSPEPNEQTTQAPTINTEPEPILDTVEPTEDPALTKLIADWTKDRDATFAVSVRELTGAKRFASYNEGKQMITASTYKLFLSFVILQHVEAGDFTLKSSTAGGLTIEACIETLLVESSDDCAYDLGNLIGWERVNASIKQAGFTDTNINNYTSGGGFKGDKVSTARDESKFLQQLEEGELLNEVHSNLLLGFMKRQIWRERIVAGLPNNVSVASKPGFLYDIENDAGIVYGEKSTYVMVLLSDGSSPQALADLSAKIYSYLHSDD